MRQDKFIALGSEMAGYVVGPMPTGKFLDFLPRIHDKKRRPFSSSLFAELAKQTRETEMYAPFVRVLLFSTIHRPH